MPGPLHGLRIVDLTSQLAGPYGTMLLADLGADVIKVEPPRGDVMRRSGPYRDDDELRAFGGYFQSVNRGKRSIVLDLRSEEGVDTLLALVAESDALVENFDVGVMEGLGMPYERLRGINPRLVYGSMRGFGDPRTGNSPCTGEVAGDALVRALTGSRSLGSSIDDGAGARLADLFPATLCTVGVIAALLHAQRTGEGQYVDVSTYDGLLSLCGQIVCQHAYGAEGAPRATTIADILAEAQVERREMLVPVPHPGCPEPVVLVGQPIKFTGTPAGVGGRAPLLDEHGDDIRREVAFAPNPFDDDLEDRLEMT